MHKFKIPVGDWSDDGHGKCEEYIVSCNYPVEEVQQAYKDSCKLTGISFNHNEDYTGLGLNRQHPEYEDRKIASEYGQYTISRLAEGILAKHGIDVWEGFDSEIIDKSGEKAYIDGSEHFIELLFAFIKLSLRGLKYEIVGDDLPYLNGYWDPSLNVQFGYGLFE